MNLQRQLWKTLKEFAYYLFVGLFSLVISFWAFKENLKGLFHNAIPLAGDGNLIGLFIQASNEASIKDLLQSKVTNTSVGWPGFLDFSTFPVGQLGDSILIRVFSSLINETDPAVLMHSISILKAFPISLAALLFLRTLKSPRLISAIIAVTYSVSSYNLIRAEGHFFLGLTWSIPLGLTALFIAFRYSKSQDLDLSVKQKRLTHFKIITLLVPVAFAAFYYVIFLILLTSFMIAGSFISEFIPNTSNAQVKSLRDKLRFCVKKVNGFFIILLVLFFGIISQLFWNYRSEHGFTLSGVADRSPIESVIYSGTIEGFFFDAGKLFLNIAERPDLVNFFASRISWEGSQVGAISGLAAYLFLLFAVLGVMFKTFSSKIEIAWLKNFKPSVEFLFIQFTLIAALALYLISPLNFGISRVIPEVRAWGRLSVFLTILIAALIGVMFSSFTTKKFLRFFVALAMFFVPISEVNYFRNYRPLSSDLSASALQTKQLRLNSLANLKSTYVKNCALFQAPLYPFPEYDRPDDNNIDYAQLDLPLVDDGYFKWSAPVIKGTKNAAAFHPLASVQPPFNRANLQFQIEYAAALGFCGAVVDRSLLNSAEALDLEKLKSSSKPGCAVELKGEEYQGQARFISLKLAGFTCKLEAPQSVVDFQKYSVITDLLWQIDQPYGLKYINQWQVFPSNSLIGLRLVKSKNLNGHDLIFNIQVSLRDTNKRIDSISVCVRKSGSLVNDCEAFVLDRENRLQLPIKPEYLTTSLVKLELSLSPKSAALVENWGLVIQKR
jgi:hypothetical protein